MSEEQTQETSSEDKFFGVKTQIGKKSEPAPVRKLVTLRSRLSMILRQRIGTDLALVMTPRLMTVSLRMS